MESGAWEPCRVSNTRRARRPRGSLDLAVEQERDGECEEHQRLDERETENHRGLDAGRRAGVPADAFERRSGSPALTERTTEGRQRDREARAERCRRLNIEGVRAAARTLLGESRRRDECGHRAGDEGQLLLIEHSWSP